MNGKATSGTLALTFLGVILGAPLFGLQAALALVVATLLFTFGTRRAAPADAPHGA